MGGYSISYFVRSYLCLGIELLRGVTLPTTETRAFFQVQYLLLSRAKKVSKASFDRVEAQKKHKSLLSMLLISYGKNSLHERGS